MDTFQSALGLYLRTEPENGDLGRIRQEYIERRCLRIWYQQGCPRVRAVARWSSPDERNSSAIPGWGEWDNTPIGDPPPVPFSPSVANTLTNAASGGGLREFSPNATAPYALAWNFGVQRELPWNLFLSASYVGNRVLHLPSMLNEINQLNPATLSALCPEPAPDATGHVTNPTCLLSPDNPSGPAWTGAPQQASLQSLGFPLAPAITCPANSNTPGLSQGPAYAPYATF